MSKYSKEYFIFVLKTLKLFLIDNKYIDSKTKLTLKDNEGYLYYNSPRELQGKVKYNYKMVKFHPNNPYTIQNIKLWLKLNNKPYQLVSDKYIKLKSVLTFKDKDSYYYTSNMDNLLYGKLPEQFAKSNPFVLQNIKLWLEINNKKFKILSTEYITASKNLKWQCLKEECGEIYDLSWNCVSNGEGCPYCSGHQVGLSNCLATKNPELAKEWHPTKNGKLTPWDITCGSNKKVWWKCRECRHEWPTKINSRTSKNKTGCPQCNESKGEKKIRYFWYLMNLPYESQYSFDNLLGIGGGLLKFDSALFWDNEKTKLRLLVEYDGIFHYEKQYDDDGFENLQIHDKRKNDYCLTHNIPLLRIPYWEFENLESILDNFIYPFHQSSSEKEVILV